MPRTEPQVARHSRAPGLSILIPVFNERDTIGPVLSKVRGVRFPVETELIVVDDGSTDGSDEVLRNLPEWDNVRVFFKKDNEGKGSAIQTALRHVRGNVLVIQDADEELDPNELPALFEPVHRGETQVCYGSRFSGDVRRFRFRPTYWANRVLTGICNLLNGQRLTDMNTCYKMMRSDVARRLDLVSRGFEIEPEITTKLARMGITITERPIQYEPRSAAEGKKARARDFLRYLAAMIRFRFRKNANAGTDRNAARPAKRLVIRPRAKHSA